MNEERTMKCLQQVEHIHGHLWHRYSITVNQVMLATVKLSRWWLQLNQVNINKSRSLIQNDVNDLFVLFVHLWNFNNKTSLVFNYWSSICFWNYENYVHGN